MAKKISELSPAYSAWFGENGILSTALGAWLPASFATGAQGQTLTTGKVELINVLKDIAPIKISGSVGGQGYIITYNGTSYDGTNLAECITNLATAQPDVVQKLIIFSDSYPGSAKYDLAYIEKTNSSVAGGNIYTFHQLSQAGDTKANTKLYMDSYLKQNHVTPEYADLTDIILPAINYSEATPPNSKGMFWYQLMNQFIIDRKYYSTGSSTTTPTYELTAPLTIFSKPIGSSSADYSQPTEIHLLPKWYFGLILFTDPRTTTTATDKPFNVQLYCPTTPSGIKQIDNIVYTSFVSTDNYSHSTGALRLLFYYTNPTMGVGFDGKLFTLI